MAGCFDEVSTVDFRFIKERVMKATVDAFGRLDLAFNNAGIQVPLSE